MSIYVRCPSCGAILADKELAFIKFKEQLEIKNLSEKEKNEEIKKFFNTTFFNNYCCKMRLYTSNDNSDKIV